MCFCPCLLNFTEEKSNFVLASTSYIIPRHWTAMVIWQIDVLSMWVLGSYFQPQFIKLQIVEGLVIRHIVSSGGDMTSVFFACFRKRLGGRQKSEPAREHVTLTLHWFGKCHVQYVAICSMQYRSTSSWVSPCLPQQRDQQVNSKSLHWKPLIACSDQEETAYCQMLNRCWLNGWNPTSVHHCQISCTNASILHG